MKTFYLLIGFLFINPVYSLGDPFFVPAVPDEIQEEENMAQNQEDLETEEPANSDYPSPEVDEAPEEPDDSHIDTQIDD